MTTEDWIKLIVPLLGGGVVGSIITALVTNSRNKVQPVSRRITVSSVDIPAIMPGYDSKITLQSATGSSYPFDKISTIQIELSNIGNQDIGSFDVGVTLPPDAKIIGIQYKNPDRLHCTTHNPTIDIDDAVKPDSISNQVDFNFTPFNRKDTYTVTLVTSYLGDNLLNKIELSKTKPVKFVDATLIDKELAELIKNTVKDYPFTSFYILPVIVGMKILAKRLGRQL